MTSLSGKRNQQLLRAATGLSLSLSLHCNSITVRFIISPASLRVKFTCLIKSLSSMMACRQHGKSYLGVINQAKNSFCSVDIPFTYISNIVSCSLYC